MTSRRPLVSVILPHRNRAHLLRLSLPALAAQTYSPIEIILADDGSTDDSVRVAERLGAKVVKSPTTSGPPAARNLGAEQARGQILLFVDSDIALEPDAVANAVQLLESDPQLGAVGGILLPESLVTRSLAARYRAIQMYRWWMPTHRPTLELHAALLAMPARVFTEIGPFDPRLIDTESADYRGRLTRRYRVKITELIRGTHDHDGTLPLILRNVYRRARLSTAQWRRGELPGDSLPRAVAGLLLLGAVAAAPLAILGLLGAAPSVLGLIGWIALPSLTALAIALDAGTYRYFFTQRGLAVGLYFSMVHLLVTLTGAAGGAVGVLERILSRRRRAQDERTLAGSTPSREAT